MKIKSLFMNKLALILIGFFLISCSNSPTSEKTTSGGLEHLTKASFKEKIFDFENSNAWNYKGSEPCIIDFYASWCGPCRVIAPTLEKLAEEYKGKIKIYKVDVDAERDLAMAFGIQSIPTLYFCPVGENPSIEYGALSKEYMQEIINNKLLKANI